MPVDASRRTGLHILNPESAGPSERPRYHQKMSYAHAVSRSFAYETRRHHPGSVLRRRFL